MTSAAPTLGPVPTMAAPFWRRPAAVWTGLLLAAIIFTLTAKSLVPAAFDYPKAFVVPIRRWLGALMKWLVDEASFGLFTFREATRAIASVLDLPYQLVLGLLADGFTRGAGADIVQVLPPLSFAAVILGFAAFGLWSGGRRLSLLAGGAMLAIAVFGQWQPAMVTLASIVVAVPIGVAGGLSLGILAFRRQGFERAISPVLDLMQTMPVFAYLVPILVLFGFGPVSAILATVIFAMPPMIRTTVLGLRGVAPELSDLGHMTGCSRGQLMRLVLLPAAKPALMVGVNQVIMLSLNMVIIASMIGAGGLGFDVLTALRRLDIGGGIEAGLAIVLIAVVLDRLSQAAAHRQPLKAADRPILLVLTGLAAALTLAGALLPALARYPEAYLLTTGTAANAALEWINVNFFDAFEAVKNAVLLNLLVPVKRFLIEVPWVVAVVLLGYAGYLVGGPRRAAMTAGMTAAIAVVGLWEPAMVTVYLCAVSVAVAALIGIPVGILAADRPRFGKVTEAVIDTLQTLPSFVYLIPVVMLFRVGDFSAMIAIVAFAVVPAIRYTAHGLRQVDPQIVEAATAAGCTPRQLLLKVRLRLALPEILLGISQTILFALSMLVITALVGTRDLGQEVYIGLTKADVGRSLTAGIAIAFIAIIADRLVTGAAARAGRREVHP